MIIKLDRSSYHSGTFGWFILAFVGRLPRLWQIVEFQSANKYWLLVYVAVVAQPSSYENYNRHHGKHQICLLVESW